nr:hypothetical protein [Tanacetum cinerariifolium]
MIALMTTRKPEVDARERLAVERERALEECEKAIRKSETEAEMEAATHVNSMEAHVNSYRRELIARERNITRREALLLQTQRTGELSLLAVGTSSSSGKSSLFCKDKGIKREYSVAKTPQQNEVAERRNRTLIEAARTMALVTKPHNKTPYELIHGRPPLIDFMKPFGCPVIILNIKDNLGKFNGKADEGYFVWKWTRLLFDIDYFTISMNYVPVVTGNQTNGIVGSKENLVAGTKDNAEDAGKKAGEANASEASNNGGHDYQVPRSKIEILLQQERQTAHNNSTNGINTISSPVSTAGPSFVNTALPSPINDAGPSARTNAFEDERGIVIKNKARLVAQEHTQEEGIDYDEVFAPVARIEAIRLFLAYDSFKDFVVYQMDVKSDFKYGKIE